MPAAREGCKNTGTAPNSSPPALPPRTRKAARPKRILQHAHFRSPHHLEYAALRPSSLPQHFASHPRSKSHLRN